ncbi:helix-turn-helix domain-containing protein [Streptomyces sp. NPDC055210]
MGRREQPIRPCSKSLQTLAAWLRSGRKQAGLTYEQLAAHTPFSPDTLARAASGNVPRNVEVVVAYAGACGLPAAEAERLWKLVRRDAARAAGVLNGQRGGMHISVVKDFADLHSAIVEQYQNAGSPALRKLDERIGGHGRLPHSTVSRVLKRRSRPSRRFVLAFAEAVDVRRSEVAEWGKAWDRADRERRSTRSRRASHVQSGIQDRLTKHDRVTPRDLQLLMSDLEGFARREAGIKLLVIPEAEYSQTDGPASRMTRELVVDQAQRQGDLSCPRCHKPSFGYDDAQGWRSELCTGCTAPATPFDAALAGPGPREVLAVPLGRPRLPQRVPGYSWPPSGFSASFESLGTEVFEVAAAPPEVCCRLCRSFHEADDGCRPAAGGGASTVPGGVFVAAAGGLVAAGEGGTKEQNAVSDGDAGRPEDVAAAETGYGTGESGAFLQAADDARGEGGPPGTRVPSAGTGTEVGVEGGVPPVAPAGRRHALAAPGAVRPAHDRPGRGCAWRGEERQQSRGPREGPRLGRDHA